MRRILFVVAAVLMATQVDAQWSVSLDLVQRRLELVESMLRGLKSGDVEPWFWSNNAVLVIPDGIGLLHPDERKAVAFAAPRALSMLTGRKVVWWEKDKYSYPDLWDGVVHIQIIDGFHRNRRNLGIATVGVGASWNDCRLNAHVCPVVQQSTMRLYIGGFEQYLRHIGLAPSLWAWVTAHEMGHIAGLMHPSDGGYAHPLVWEGLGMQPGNSSNKLSGFGDPASLFSAAEVSASRDWYRHNVSRRQ